MGMYKPAQGIVVARLRAIGRALYKRAVRYEPVYVLPWVASRAVTTSLLLENNQIEYSRRRRGMASSVAVDVRRYDRSGRVTLQSRVDVRPGAPVVVDATSDCADLDHGFYQLTDSSQYYVQIQGPHTCALTHGRSTVILHYRGAAASLVRAAAAIVRPYRKGFNFIYAPDLYETIVMFNLSSARNVIDLKVEYESDDRRARRIVLAPYGSELLRFDEGIASGDRPVRGFARMRASGPFDFYVLQTRSLPPHEALSIQHVN